MGKRILELAKCGLLSLVISTPLSLFGYFAAFAIAHASEGALTFFQLIYAPAFFILDRAHESGVADENTILLQMFVAQWAYWFLVVVLCRLGWRLYVRLNAGAP
jgi:hypothetical protein